MKQLKDLNKLKSNNLKPGQVLKIPPAKSETPAPPPAKPTAKAKPAAPAKSIVATKSSKPVSAPSQSKTASTEPAYLRAQPVQDFDIPASTFASCPTPPGSSDTDAMEETPAPPPPAVAEIPSHRALPVTSAEVNETPAAPSSTTHQTVLTQSTPTPVPSSSSSKLFSSSSRPFVASSSPSSNSSSEWANRFLQAARDLGNRDIDYDESWRPPGEAHSWDMDCSNTARYLYKVTTGIQLPRTASDQYYYLHLQNKAWDVPQASSGFADCNFLRQNLKPGDLLFWENTYKPERQPPITHVMVFLGTNSKGQWIMAGSQTGRGGEHNRRHGGPDIYVFDPTRPCGGYTTWLGMVHHQGKFCAYGRPLEADKSKLAVAAND